MTTICSLSGNPAETRGFGTPNSNAVVCKASLWPLASTKNQLELWWRESPASGEASGTTD